MGVWVGEAVSGLHEDGGGQEEVEGDIPVPQRPSGYGCDLTLT